MADRTIIVGDIHGCLEEFEELLLKVEHTSEDRLILAGDLVDRGPDSAGVVRKARELGAECVLGNHELKYVRWREWERKVACGEASKNPMQFNEEKKNLYTSFRSEDLDWMTSLPAYLHVAPSTIVVHGGLEAKPLSKQNKKLMTMCRYLNSNGTFVGLKRDLSQPGGSVYWTEMWKGPESVFYGHIVHEEIRIDEGENHTCWGIDTGCVFGGKLTAAILTNEGLSFCDVPAKTVYSK